MINKLKKALIIGGLVLAEGTYTGGNFINENSKNTKEIYESYESSRLEKLVEEYRESVFKQRAEEQSSDKIRVPYFRISSGNCSEYAKKSAHKLFGKEYVWDKKKHDAGAAWNLRYYNPVINEIDSIGEIKELIIEGNLKPGMILGMYNPKSKYNRK
ncbi:MAG: hypothetical protein NTZ83_05275, partial [Candidatus Pacearchaeota archaeon]|nr:hypothetical protein [Candidatus Pacearchaeota archaeon]